MKYFIPFLLLPSLLYGQQQQPVEPVLSADYLGLIKKEQLTILPGRDTSLLQLTMRRNFYFRDVGKVKVSGNRLKLQPLNNTSFRLSGNFSTTVEFRQANRQPAVQNTYAQGRAENGALAWRGGETGEPFSYGPSLAILEYDGSSNYPYDAHGRMVPAGTGNGRAPALYDNNIFRTASYLSQSITLQAGAKGSYRRQWELNARLGRSRENTFLRYNRNSTDHLAVSLKRQVRIFSFTGGYKYQRNGFSNPNRNGFLNRAYMNTLLTPAGFSNRYSGLPYGNGADNPYSLLEHSPNSYAQTQHNAHLVTEYDNRNVDLKITQSYDRVSENGHEAYARGTAGFPDGTATQRERRDGNYYLRTDLTYTIYPRSYAMRSFIKAYHIFTDTRTSVQYRPQQQRYAFQRNTNEVRLQYTWQYLLDQVKLYADAGNTFYFSNTAGHTRHFAPLLNARAEVYIFNRKLRLDVYSSFQALNSELPVNSALSYTNLLQYPVASFTKYFPLMEATGYDGLLPVRSRMYNATATLSYRLFSLSAEWFRKNVLGDVFPLHHNGELRLANVAAHRKQGLELILSQQSASHKKIRSDNAIALLRYRHVVTDVAAPGAYLPVAGFADVHKVVAKGAAMGAIAGSNYLRNAEGRVIVGADGFPLVNGQTQIIGNPIPDFVVKLNNQLYWKKLIFSASWEWKKGGETWNGTQAALDYYGRSAASATARNTMGYVFDGVQENGHTNNIPVSFYDPAQPLEHNRWVQYGLSGVAEEYIRKSDYLRLNTVRLGYQWKFGKVVQSLHLSAYATNILVWSPYEGADPQQLLFDQPNTAGLDFFNLPSTRTYGLNASLQF